MPTISAHRSSLRSPRRSLRRPRAPSAARRQADHPALGIGGLLFGAGCLGVIISSVIGVRFRLGARNPILPARS
jgi:hypothetical protein